MGYSTLNGTSVLHPFPKGSGTTEEEGLGRVQETDMVDGCKETGFSGYIWEVVYTNLNVFDSMSKTNTGTDQTTFRHKKSMCVLSSSPS